MPPHTPKGQRPPRSIHDGSAEAAQLLLSLSIAMMRADAALAAYELARAEIPDRELTDADHAALDTAMLRLENNAFTQARAHLSIWFAMLYVVIEGWRKWGFSDPRVDSLLQSDHVDELRAHRNAVFHADDFNAPAVMRFVATPGRSKWLTEISSALRQSLRERNRAIRLVEPG